MDILVIEQIWTIFLLGVFALNTCSRLGKKEQEFLENPHNSYGREKLDIAKPKTHSRTLMTLIGTGLCFGAMFLFMMYI
jgi:hypothetical protein